MSFDRDKSLHEEAVRENVPAVNRRPRFLLFPREGSSYSPSFDHAITTLAPPLLVSHSLHVRTLDKAVLITNGLRVEMSGTASAITSGVPGTLAAPCSCWEPCCPRWKSFDAEKAEVLTSLRTTSRGEATCSRLERAQEREVGNAATRGVARGRHVSKTEPPPQQEFEIRALVEADGSLLRRCRCAENVFGIRSNPFKRGTPKRRTRNSETRGAAEHGNSDVRALLNSAVRCWELDVGCSMLNALDPRPSTLDRVIPIIHEGRPFHRRAFCAGRIRFFRAALRAPADVREDAPAVPRWNAECLDDLHALFSRRAFGRVCICLSRAADWIKTICVVPLRTSRDRRFRSLSVARSCMLQRHGRSATRSGCCAR